LSRIVDRALRSGRSQDSSCYLEDLCAPEVSRHAQLFLYNKSTRLYYSRQVLFTAELRLKLLYNFSAAVGARANRDAAALSDRYYIAVSRVRFLTDVATRFDRVVVVNALYSYYTYQHLL